VTRRADLDQALDAVPLADAGPEAWRRWRERMHDIYRVPLPLDDGDCLRMPLGWYVVVPMAVDYEVTERGVRETRVRSGDAWLETDDGRRIDLPRAVLDAAEAAMEEVRG